MRTLLTVIILIASIPSPQPPPPKQEAIHYVEETEPPHLGRLLTLPPPADTKVRQRTSRDRGTTRASWYDTRPTYCYKPGRTRVPPTELWVAHKTLPCGTLIEVSGPKGALVLPVYDRGPYVPGRELDISAEAFKLIVGPLSQGVGTVTYRVMN